MSKRAQHAVPSWLLWVILVIIILVIMLTFIFGPFKEEITRQVQQGIITPLQNK